ncbi:putative polyamine transporter [Viridothelium virens]|uniref:Putative polyamine transporter n=1 Tax=Viridothelium virens TaxID=1048519 RepID=A0A6A6HAV6_VIRVR|nr:putative polyamine transporter [Viridothelium virens]
MQTESPISGTSEKAGLQLDPEAVSVESSTVNLIPAPTQSPDDPLNWASWRKATAIFTLALTGLFMSGAPTANQLGYVVQAPLYHKTPNQMSYGASASIAGFIAGPFAYPFLFGLFGRVSVLFWSIVVLFFCQVWAAEMTSSGDFIPLIMSRWIAGLTGSVAAVVGNGYIIDTCFLHQRGRLFAVFELSFLFGAVGPTTIGGFIVQNQSLGWPWMFWWTCIALGVCAVLVFFFVEETNFDRLNNTCIRPQGSYLAQRLTTVFTGWKVIPRSQLSEMGSRTLKSFEILIAPVTIATGLYSTMAFGFSIMCQLFINIIIQLPPQAGGYGFTPQRNGYFSFTSWVALLVAWTIGSLVNDRIPLQTARRNQGVWHPEYRLLPLVIPGLLLPIGLGIYGAALEYHLHYMVLALGQFLVQLSSQLSVPICVNYVTESFISSPIEVAIAMNAWRLFLGLGLPFATEPWIEKVGPGWAFGTAAFMMVAAGLWMIVVAMKGHALRRLQVSSHLADAEDGAVVS